MGRVDVIGIGGNKVKGLNVSTNLGVSAGVGIGWIQNGELRGCAE